MSAIVQQRDELANCLYREHGIGRLVSDATYAQCSCVSNID